MQRRFLERASIGGRTRIGASITVMSAVISSLLAMAACDPVETAAGTAMSPTEPRFAKGAAIDPLVRYSFADSINVALPGQSAQYSLAGIRGDGRNASGQTGSSSRSNEYQSKYCGVDGQILQSGVEHGVFNTDPDIYWTSSMQGSCGESRQFRFYLSGLYSTPTFSGPHTVVDSLGVLSIGQTGSRLVRFGVQLPNCAGIRFANAYPGSSDAKVTRLTDVITSNGNARRWLVESQGTHRGACVVAGRKDFVPTGVTYYLPFAITITEVLPPFITYP